MARLTTWLAPTCMVLSVLCLGASQANAQLPDASACSAERCSLSPVALRVIPNHVSRVSLLAHTRLVIAPVGANALPATHRAGSVSSKAASARPARPAKPVRTRDPGVRGSWRLRGGKELSVALTPTPQHCAPLVSMSF